jgi:hypothetical protein
MSAFPGKRIGREKRPEASVVLRRQVPVRFDEPARSWLGGLPQMPDNIRWPRTARNGASLHFVAQIACADLPKQIWNGRGPRDGWLLLFVDVLQMEDSSEDWENCDDLSDFFWLACRRAAGLLGFGGGGLVRVLHINRLGPERQPPEDMSTVRHVMSDSIGRYTPTVREGVPKLWRRWPVDLVVQEVPPPPSEDSGKWEPLQITGADLYGAPEDDENIDRFADAELRPLTWRGALYLVDGIKVTMAKQAFDGLLTAPSPEPGWLAAKIAMAETDILRYEADAAAAAADLQKFRSTLTPEQRASLERYIATQREAAALERRNLADLSVFSRSGGEAALGAEIERLGAAHLIWRDEQPRALESLRTRILGKDLEAPLGADDWSTLKAGLTASPTEYWNNWTYARRKEHGSLLDYGNNSLPMVLREDVLDLYTRDAAARAVIPPAIMAEIEPKLRNIGISRAPHRIGGPCDVVQDYASRADDDLLFQIFSDDAMGWMWGDLGALFVYLKPLNLKARWFKRAYAWIDGH